MTEKACDSRENQAAPRAASMPAAPDGTSLWRFAGPRVLANLVRARAHPPVNSGRFRVQMFLGGVLGSLAFAFARRERHVAALNKEMCLPERGERERPLMRAHFASLGKSLFETALVWWAEDQRLKRIIRIDGVEHLSTALAEAGCDPAIGPFHDARNGCTRALHPPSSDRDRSIRCPRTG